MKIKVISNHQPVDVELENAAVGWGMFSMFSLGRPPSSGSFRPANVRVRQRGYRNTVVCGLRDDRDIPELLKRFQEGTKEVEDAETKDKRVKSKKKKKKQTEGEKGGKKLNKYGLEFFDKEFFREINERPVRTARPIPREGLLSCNEAAEYAASEAKRAYDEEVKLLLDTKQITEEDAEELKEELQREVDTPSFQKTLTELETEGAKMPDPNAPRPENMSMVESLMYDWEIPECLRFQLGPGGTPVACLSHPSGEELKIHLQGACITSWKRFDGREAFLVNPDTVFKDGELINSGLCLAFPQYGHGGLPFDGFAGRVMWEVVAAEVSAPWLDDPAPSITLRCCDSEYTRSLWDHKFEMFYKITLGVFDDPPSNIPTEKEKRVAAAKQLRRRGMRVPSYLRTEPPPIPGMPPEGSIAYEKRLNMMDLYEENPAPPSDPTQITMEFTIKNRGDKPMEFLLATKPNFRTSDLGYLPGPVSALGLGGKIYLDYTVSPGRPRLRQQNTDYTDFKVHDGGMHSIYTDCQVGDVLFCPGTPVHYELINRTGFPDVVVYQAGDQSPEIYRWSRFCTVFGRAHLTTPIRLLPGEEWYGETVLRFRDTFYEEPIFGFQGREPVDFFPKRPGEFPRKSDIY